MATYQIGEKSRGIIQRALRAASTHAWTMVEQAERDGLFVAGDAYQTQAHEIDALIVEFTREDDESRIRASLAPSPRLGLPHV